MVTPVFNILSVKQQDDVITLVLDIDASSEVFAGHFPGHPVVPGACMVQLVKDVLTNALDTPVRLLKANNIKFLELVTPDGSSLALTVTYLKTGELIKVNASLQKQDVVCMKFSGTFK